MNERQLEDARQELAARFPSFATLLSYFKGRMVPSPGTGTIGVDRGMRVYFDPELKWRTDEIIGALEHELGHVARNHFQRAEQYEQVRAEKVNPWHWNVAGDLEINDDLVYPLPDGYGIRAKKYGLEDGGIAEVYYPHVAPKLEDQAKDDQGGGEGAEGQDGGEESQSGDQGGQDEQEPGDQGASGSQSGGSQGPGDQGQDQSPGGQDDSGGSGGNGGDEGYSGHDGDCGSVAGGPARDHELPMEDEKFPGVLPEQVERAVEEAKKTTGKEMAGPQQGEDEARDEAKRRGQQVPGAPGELSRMAGSIFGPGMKDVYDHYWEAVLHREVSKFLKVGGSSYLRPSRRLYDRKIIHTGRGKVNPTIAIVVDTSGSIGATAANKAFGIVGKFRGWNLKIRVVACDSEAKEVKAGDTGFSGGGTILEAGIEYVKEHFGKVDACFVVTDGECMQWGEDPKRFPVTVFTWAYDGPEWSRTVRMPALDEEWDEATGHQGIRGGTYRQIYYEGR